MYSLKQGTEPLNEAKTRGALRGLGWNERELKGLKRRFKNSLSTMIVRCFTWNNVGEKRRPASPSYLKFYGMGRKTQRLVETQRFHLCSPAES